MGADQNFFRNRSVDLYPKNHHKPSNLASQQPTGQTGSGNWSDWSFPDSPKFNLQKMNLEQTMSKSNETWRIPSQLFCEHIPKRSLPKDQRNLRIRGMIKVDWGFLKNVKNSNS